MQQERASQKRPLYFLHHAALHGPVVTDCATRDDSPGSTKGPGRHSVLVFCLLVTLATLGSTSGREIRLECLDCHIMLGCHPSMTS